MQDSTPPANQSHGTAHAYVNCDSEIEGVVADWRARNPHLVLVEVSTASFYRGRETPFDVHMVGLQFRSLEG